MAQAIRPPSPNINPRHQPVLCGGYSPIALEVVQQMRTKNLQKCLQHCRDSNPNERRAGLCNLLIYMRRGDTSMNDASIILVRNTLNRFFHEHSSKLYRVFIEVLHDFIQLYCYQIEGWIETVVRKLVGRLGSELLASLRTLIKGTLSSLQQCYVPGFLFKITGRIIFRDDNFEPKAKLELLDYLAELLPLLQPEDFFDHTDLQNCLFSLATDLNTTNSKLRLKTQDVLYVLFDLNPTTFNLFLTRLPSKLESILTRSIRRHWAKVIENEKLSPRNTFRPPPHEDLRGCVQNDKRLRDNVSLSDLLYFPSDSDDNSSDEQLSKSLSLTVTTRDPANSKLGQYLNLFSVDISGQTDKSSVPTPPSQSPPPIPTSLPPVIPQPNFSTSESDLSSPNSIPPPIPTTPPPPLQLSDPLSFTHTSEFDCISESRLDTHSLREPISSPAPPILEPRSLTKSLRSRIPISVNSSPHSEIVRFSSELRTSQSSSPSNNTFERINNFDSSPIFLQKSSNRRYSYIDSNPVSSDYSCSKIPRYISSPCNPVSPLSKVSISKSKTVDSDIYIESSYTTDYEQNSTKKLLRVKSATTPDKDGRRYKMCLNFRDKKEQSSVFPDSSISSSIQSREFIEDTPGDKLIRHNSLENVTPPSIVLSARFNAISAPPSSQIFQSLQTPGLSEILSPSYHSLELLLNSFISTESVELRTNTLNELREKLKTYSLVPPPADIQLLLTPLTTAVREILDFSSQVSNQTLLVSIHTIYLITELSPSVVSHKTEQLTKLLIESHGKSCHTTRSKLEDLFIILLQSLNIPLVISLVTGCLSGVSINYLTPLKLFGTLIPHTPPQILSSQLSQFAPDLVFTYQQQMGIQNAALPCLVRLYNSLGSDLDPYLTELTPSQEKLLMMYVKSSVKK